jgi:hypothetical protein
MKNFFFIKNQELFVCGAAICNIFLDFSLFIPLSAMIALLERKPFLSALMQHFENF